MWYFSVSFVIGSRVRKGYADVYKTTLMNPFEKPLGIVLSFFVYSAHTRRIVFDLPLAALCDGGILKYILCLLSFCVSLSVYLSVSLFVCRPVKRIICERHPDGCPRPDEQLESPSVVRVMLCRCLLVLLMP